MHPAKTLLHACQLSHTPTAVIILSPLSSGTLTAGVDRVTGTRSENYVRAACGEAAGSSQTLNPGSLRAWYHASGLNIFSISVRRCVAVLLTLCCGFWCGGCHVAVRPLTIIFCGIVGTISTSTICFRRCDSCIIPKRVLKQVLRWHVTWHGVKAHCNEQQCLSHMSTCGI